MLDYLGVSIPVLRHETPAADGNTAGSSDAGNTWWSGEDWCHGNIGVIHAILWVVAKFCNRNDREFLQVYPIV